MMISKGIQALYSTPPYYDNGLAENIIARATKSLITICYCNRKEAKKKCAFTLAETLITLVIVGVVAALTIPNMIVKYQKEETVTRIKKTYSELAQAVKLSEISNGPSANWDYDSMTCNSFFKLYLLKYLKTYPNTTIQNNKNIGVTYSTLNGKSTDNIYPFVNNSQIYTLMSGEQLFISSGDPVKQNKISRCSIGIDINGYKKPNKIGRDLFITTISNKYGFQPYNWYANVNIIEENRDKLITSSDNNACNKNKLGYWCAYLIMKDGWKISDDYPW